MATRVGGVCGAAGPGAGCDLATNAMHASSVTQMTGIRRRIRMVTPLFHHHDQRRAGAPDVIISGVGGEGDDYRFTGMCIVGKSDVYICRRGARGNGDGAAQWLKIVLRRRRSADRVMDNERLSGASISIDAKESILCGAGARNGSRE